MSVFVKIETVITGSIDSLFTEVGNLISAIAPIFATLFAIYLMLWVFNYWANGGLVEMGVDLIKKLVAWSLVIGIAFNATEFTQYAKLIYNFSGDLASALTGGSIQASAMDTNWGTLDKIFDKFEDKGADFNEIWDMGNAIAFVLYISFYKFCSFLFIAVVFMYYLIAKLLLLCTLMVGPLFLGCFLFPATRQWAMNWINAIWNYTITVLLFVVLGMIQDEFFTNAMLPLVQNMERRLSAMDGVMALGMLMGEFPLILCGTILFAWLATKIPPLASALTGGSAQVSGVSMRMSTAGSVAKSTMNVAGGIMASPIRMVSRMLGNNIKPK
ncbi:MAG: type IV secretion system protein [Neisseriaceae bacterium]|nr:type IV secretion system protein [Neisseriaceae bacterium]